MEGEDVEVVFEGRVFGYLVDHKKVAKPVTYSFKAAEFINHLTLIRKKFGQGSLDAVLIKNHEKKEVAFLSPAAYNRDGFVLDKTINGGLYRILPLEWIEVKSRWVARNSFIQYCIEETQDGCFWSWFLGDDSGEEPCSSIEHGKELAIADWIGRLEKVLRHAD